MVLLLGFLKSYVEPSGVMSVAPGSIPAGMVSIKIPNRGYVFAVPAVVGSQGPILSSGRTNGGYYGISRSHLA